MQDESNGKIIHLIDVISTNVTSFFREAVHFDFLSKIASNWFSQGLRRFRFWSAACSSGEEPYSITITLYEILKDRYVEMKILATDISTQIIDHAEIGSILLANLSLPPAIVEVVRWHHQPENFQRNSVAVDLVHVADVLCMMGELGIGSNGLNYHLSKDVFSRLHLKICIIKKVISQIHNDFNEPDIISINQGITK